MLLGSRPDTGNGQCWTGHQVAPLQEMANRTDASRLAREIVEQFRRAEPERAVRAAANDARAHRALWLEGAARLALGRVQREIPGAETRARAALEEAHQLLSAAQPPDPVGVAYVRAHQARMAADAGRAFLA